MNTFYKIFKKLIYILKNFFLYFHPIYYKLRIHLHKKNYEIIKKTNKKIFLFEHFESLSLVLIKSILLPVMAKNTNSDLYCFNLGFNYNYYKLYKSFGLKKKISIKLNTHQESIVENIFKKHFENKILTKKGIFNFKIDNIHLGIDIYESYLIRNHQATLNLKDTKLFILIRNALQIYIFWKDFLKRNKVSGIYINQRTYIENNILNRLAMRNKIPVFSGGTNGLIQKFTKNIMTFSHTYKKLFNSLSSKEKQLAIKLSKIQLKKRLSGKVGVDMPYSLKSAYHSKNISYDFSSNKKKILICTHCFYDNPHPFGGSIFLDFYEWLIFLADISQITDYDWYIKPHPDYLPGTLETLSTIMKKFKNVQLLDPRMSFHQISKHIKYATTSHGSIAHELPLLGMYVINADTKNPHQAFNFSYTAKNLKDYKHTLLNLNLLKKNIFNIKEVYNFYYMHYYYFNKNSFFPEIQKYKYLKNSTLLINDFIEAYIKNKNFNNNLNNKFYKFLSTNDVYLKKDNYKT